MDWALTAYWVCFGVGTLYATVSALLGGLHGVFEHGGGAGGGGGVEMSHDYGAGHGTVTADGHGDAYATPGESEPVISPLSPATISIFLATFGGVGIILTSMFKQSLFVSVPVSAGAGVGVASFVMLLFYHLFTKVQGSSEPRQAEAIGLAAEVTVPVPGDGVGEVAYICRGARFVSPARSQTGQELARHAAVRIISQVGNTFYVEPLAAEPQAAPVGQNGQLKD